MKNSLHDNNFRKYYIAHLYMFDTCPVQ